MNGFQYFKKLNIVKYIKKLFSKKSLSLPLEGEEFGLPQNSQYNPRITDMLNGL